MREGEGGTEEGQKAVIQEGEGEGRKKGRRKGGREGSEREEERAVGTWKVGREREERGVTRRDEREYKSAGVLLIVSSDLGIS